VGGRDWLWWLMFAGIAVLGGGIAFVMWPHPRVTYCTAGFGTCIANMSGQWLVLYTMSSRSITTVRLRRGIPLSFDQAARFFDAAECLPHSLCEVAANGVSPQRGFPPLPFQSPDR
jgi:hypothetical protein